MTRAAARVRRAGACAARERRAPARARGRRPSTTPARRSRCAAPARRIVSLAPHATELLFAVGAGIASSASLDTSDWPPAAMAMPRVGDSRALDLERIARARARSRRHLAVRRRRRRSERCARAALPCSSRCRRRSTASRSISSGWGRSPARGGRTAQRPSAFRARLARLSRALRGRADGARVLRDLGRAAVHDRRAPPHLAGDRACAAARTCSRRLRCRRRRSSVEAVLAARPEAIVAGADGARAPGVARRLAALAGAAGGRARQPLRRRRRICCIGRAALRRRRRRAVRGARAHARR